MKKVIKFRDRMAQKINEAVDKRYQLEKNNNNNKIELKAKMIERLEERFLKAVPNWLTDKNCEIEGPIYFVIKRQGKLFIDFSYYEETVFFENFDEIRELLEEIKEHFGEGFIYEIAIYEIPGVYNATIKFNYEYKES